MGLMHPDDYARDSNGKVAVHEFNRWLPWWRCRECGFWLHGNQSHPVAKCDRVKAVRNG